MWVSMTSLSLPTLDRNPFLLPRIPTDVLRNIYFVSEVCMVRSLFSLTISFPIENDLQMSNIGSRLSGRVTCLKPMFSGLTRSCSVVDSWLT
ncbi:hypothetical protein C8T65DRAFT_144702 [Cerioporus squamosus]|nr:hypothetical protein C8T65DRAFT_144702 [Cerioporus squamosus]